MKIDNHTRNKYINSKNETEINHYKDERNKQNFEKLACRETSGNNRSNKSHSENSLFDSRRIENVDPNVLNSNNTSHAALNNLPNQSPRKKPDRIFMPSGGNGVERISQSPRSNERTSLKFHGNQTQKFSPRDEMFRSGFTQSATIEKKNNDEPKTVKYIHSRLRESDFKVNLVNNKYREYP